MSTSAGKTELRFKNHLQATFVPRMISEGLAGLSLVFQPNALDFIAWGGVNIGFPIEGVGIQFSHAMRHQVTVVTSLWDLVANPSAGISQFMYVNSKMTLERTTHSGVNGVLAEFRFQYGVEMDTQQFLGRVFIPDPLAGILVEEVPLKD